MKNIYVKNLIAILIASSFYFPASFAKADEHTEMHNEEHMHDHGDNPVVTKVMFDQLEFRVADGANPSVIEAQAWIGKDHDKLWLKTDVESRDGETQDAELQALYSHAISTYWDLQMGLRKDIKPLPSRTWGVLGVRGLTPYFFDVDVALFIGDSGRTAFRVSAEYELLFTQRLILSPNINVNFYGQNDEEIATGSGLSDAKAGLRLRYEILREFAPYIGVNWSRQFGNTAIMAKGNGDAARETTIVGGIRMWF